MNNRLYNFANEDVTLLQGFETTKRPNGQSAIQEVEESKSMYMSQFKDLSLNKSQDYSNIQQEKDLGRQVFDVLQKEFEKRNNVRTNDPDAIFQVFKVLKQTQRNKESQKLQEQFRRTALMDEDKNQGKVMSKEVQSRLFKTETGKQKMEQQDPHQKLLRAILSSKQRDVQYTLHLHAEDAKKEHNISMYLTEKGQQLQQQSRMQNKPKRSKKEVFESKARLYGQTTTQDKQRLKEYEAFTDKLIELHKKANPKVSFYRLPHELHQFWQTVAAQGQHPDLDVSSDKALKHLKKCFFKLVERIDKHFQNRKGFKLDIQQKKQPDQSVQQQSLSAQKLQLPDNQNKNSANEKNADRLFLYWQMMKKQCLKRAKAAAMLTQQVQQSQIQQTQTTTQNVSTSNFIANSEIEINKFLMQDKQYHAFGFDFENDENMRQLILDYFVKLVQKKGQQKTKDDAKALKSEIEKRDKKVKLEKKFKLERTKEEQERHILNDLAKPSDQLKSGKAMLKMQKLNHNLKLRDLILQEFKQRKYAKLPLEYDNYDSEEEQLIQGHARRVSKKQKEQMIAEHFMKELNAFQDDHLFKGQLHTDQSKKDQQDEKNMERLIAQKAKEFIAMRKKRLEEKVPSMHEFLVQAFMQLRQLHAKVLKKRFPILNKKDKAKYSVAFKRYFFQVVKRIIKGKTANKNAQKLPFWCPTQQGKCRIHEMKECPSGCTYQTMNKKAMAKSRLLKLSKVLAFRKQKFRENVWNNPDLLGDRLNFIMTFSDAQECTFQPFIEKSDMNLKSEKPQPPPKIADLKVIQLKTSHNKYGFFKQAVQMFNHGEYLNAYKKIAINFNILGLKRIFEGSEARAVQENPFSMFSYEAIGEPQEILFSEAKWPKSVQLDEDNCVQCQRRQHKLMHCQRVQLKKDKDLKIHAGFLEDVYDFVKAMEGYDHELIQERERLFPKLRYTSLEQAFQHFKRAATKNDYTEVMKAINRVFHLQSINQYFLQESHQNIQSQQTKNQLSPKLKSSSPLPQQQNQNQNQAFTEDEYPFRRLWDSNDDKRDQLLSKHYAWFDQKTEQIDRMQKESLPDAETHRKFVDIRTFEQMDALTNKEKTHFSKYLMQQSVFLLNTFIKRTERNSIVDLKKQFPELCLINVEGKLSLPSKEFHEKLNFVIATRLLQDEKAGTQIQQTQFLQAIVPTKQQIISQIEIYFKMLEHLRQQSVDGQPFNKGAGLSQTSTLRTHPDQQNMSQNQLTAFQQQQLNTKTYMCPLKDQCPDDIRPRWPAAPTKSCMPLGAKCPFAHHVYEIRFKQELMSRQKTLNDMFKTVQSKLAGATSTKPWNPGGATFKDCIGCGRQIMQKYRKGVCATCDVRIKSQAKLDKYRQKAKATYEVITKKKGFSEHKKEAQTFDANLNKKIGYLQQANILQTKERHVEAFKIICKAVQMVKLELDSRMARAEEYDQALRKTLDIDLFLDVTPEMVYKRDIVEEELLKLDTSSMTQQNKHFKQKLHYLAHKTGVIGEQKMNINDFINHQIELLYRKIEQSLLCRVKDVELMKKRIDRYEGGEADALNRSRGEKLAGSFQSKHPKMPKLDRNKMCEEVLKKGVCVRFEALKCQTNITNVSSATERKLIIDRYLNHCLKLLKVDGQKNTNEKKEELIMLLDKIQFNPCPDAHFAMELDLVDVDTKVTNLNKTIKYVQAHLGESHPPVIWNPPSKKEALVDINIFDEKQEIKQLEKGRTKHFDLAKSVIGMNQTAIPLQRTIYDQDIEELLKLPTDKSGKNKFD